MKYTSLQNKKRVYITLAIVISLLFCSFFFIPENAYPVYNSSSSNGDRGIVLLIAFLLRAKK